MQRRAHTLASPLAAASEHRTLVSTASAPLRQTRRSCAEQDLSSHAHCVPTSVADPAFAWRYRRAREEKEVPVISSELSPQRAIKTSPSLTHTQRPMAMLFPGSGSQYASMGSFLLKTYATAREVWEEAEEALAESVSVYVLAP